MVAAMGRWRRGVAAGREERAAAVLCSAAAATDVIAACVFQLRDGFCQARVSSRMLALRIRRAPVKRGRRRL